MDQTEATGYEEPVEHHGAAFSMGDLKREEEILISLYSKMKDQLHKLEVEELELKQKIRRKEYKETTEELFPPPPPPEPNSGARPRHKKSTKGKGARKRRPDRTLSTSQDETASEVDDAMSTTSAVSQSSPSRSVKTTPTPTRRSARNIKDSPGKLKAARNLTIPSFEPEKLNLDVDLSALSSFSVPTSFHHPDDFLESEDD